MPTQITCFVCRQEYEYDTDAQAEITLNQWKAQFQKVSKNRRWEIQEIVRLLKIKGAEIVMLSQTEKNKDKARQLHGDQAYLDAAVTLLEKTSMLKAGPESIEAPETK